MAGQKSDRFKTFEALGGLIKSGKLRLASPHKPASVPQKLPPKPVATGKDCDDDRRLFWEAMAGVKPLFRNYCRDTDAPLEPCDIACRDSSAETVEALRDLVKTGKGFEVALTPEYREGTGYRIHPGLTRRLHRGDFSIQDHIDLHGYSVIEARIALDDFLEQAIATRKRAVLVVHGRGLSSPGGPVLKQKVHEWLTSGRWRKWIMAYTSARRYDGGAGATYVLLRQRPASGKYPVKS